MIDVSPEDWKPVFGFDDTYRVSSHGRFKRIQTRYGNPSDKIIPGSLATTGYRTVSLCCIPPVARRYVHDIVAEAFIGPRPSGYQINHLDGNKLNNLVSNLEYVTPRENLLHAARTGLNPRANNFKLNDELVRELRRRYTETRSHKQLALEFGIDPSNVYRIVTRQQWKHVE